MSKSTDNKASVITIPRAIAQAWEQYSTVELVFDGNYLAIRPINESYMRSKMNASSMEEVSDMELSEKEYLEALEKIRELLFAVIVDFKEGDDEVSHFFEDLYDVLDEVIAM